MTDSQSHNAFKIGHGFDVHRFADEPEANASIVLGGVSIPHTHSIVAHSDGDIVYHAICDALLGAIGEGDIGKHFPDTDPQYKNADSANLLKQVHNKVIDAGYSIGNIDTTIVAQKPKLATYIEKIREVTAALLNINSQNINVKATTTEQLGYTGRGEGISVHAVVIVYKTS